MIYDLIVIGAGPGGCATAISAASRGRNVLLLERGQFPRHKVCGEFVSAESLALLADLLLPEDRGIIANAPVITSSKIYAEKATLRAEISPAAVSIARHDLDRALWESALQCGVDAREKNSVSAVNGDGPFSVTVNGKDFQGKAIVNAGGRWSFLSSPEVRSRAATERWLGIKAHFCESGHTDSVDLYFFEGGYCGVQPVRNVGGSDQVVNACAMVRTDRARTLEEVFACHPALETRSGKWKQFMEPVSTSPLIFHEPEPVRGSMLQVGDAATFVDPFIGDGISLALRSGRLAAESLQGFLEGQGSLEQAAGSYSQNYARKLAPVFRASSVLRKMLNAPRAIRRPVMSLLQYTPAVTTQLVRLTR